MNKRLQKGTESIRGNVKLPGSKSISNRVLIIQALCDKKFDIVNLSEAQDTTDLQRLLFARSPIYNTGEGGTSTRFFIAYAALNQYQCVIGAGGKMMERPVAPLVESLNQLGAKIIYINDDKKLPIQLKGYKLKGDIVELRSDQSSQFASAISLIAPYLANGLTICLNEEVVSESYLKMTLNLVKEFGIDVTEKANEIVIGNGNYSAKTVIVESDWSAASYFYVLAAFSKDTDVQLNGLRANSVQGDSVIVELMEQFGVKTTFSTSGARLLSPDQLRLPSRFEYDFISCPDLALSMIVLCAGLGIESKFTGLRTLEKKESNRVQAIKTELAKVGISLISENSDIATLKSDASIAARLSEMKDVHFNTYNDHRIAMALSTLVKRCNGIVIEDPDVVNKSFPAYWLELQELGIRQSSK